MRCSLFKYGLFRPLLIALSLAVLAESADQGLLVLSNGRIRKTPDKAGATVDGANKGDTLLLGEKKAGWCQVVGKDGKEVGWITASNVKEIPLAASPVVTEPAPVAPKLDSIPAPNPDTVKTAVPQVDSTTKPDTVKTAVPKIDSTAKPDTVKMAVPQTDSTAKTDTLKTVTPKADSAVRTDTLAAVDTVKAQPVPIVPCSLDVLKQASRDTTIYTPGRLSVLKASKLRLTPLKQKTGAGVKKNDTLPYWNLENKYYSIGSDTGILGWIAKSAVKTLSSPETSIVTLLDSVKRDSLVCVCEKRRADSLAWLDSVRVADSIALALRIRDSIAQVLRIRDSIRVADSVKLAIEMHERTFTHRATELFKAKKKYFMIGGGVLVGGVLVAVLASGGSGEDGAAGEETPSGRSEIPPITIPPP